jgi:hypothetical protein
MHPGFRGSLGPLNAVIPVASPAFAIQTYEFV